MENKELDRNLWVKNLKAGDEVCYDISVGYEAIKKYVFTKVKKITPTGKITCENGKIFDNQGEASNGHLHHTMLQPITKEILEHAYRRKMIDWMKGIDFEKLTTEQLDKIAEIAYEYKRKVETNEQ